MTINSTLKNEDLNVVIKKQEERNSTEDRNIENSTSKYYLVCIVELDYESDMCPNCINAENICTVRNSAFSRLYCQAKKMKITSDKSHPPAEIGANLTVPISDIDKAKRSLKNVITIKINKNVYNLYQLETKEGVLNIMNAR